MTMPHTRMNVFQHTVDLSSVKGNRLGNHDHIILLRRGIDTWNRWRKTNPHIEPDLQEADLCRANLQGANLQLADLRRAILRGADLRRTDLRGADLRRADLKRADLRGAMLRGADFRRADLRGAMLTGTDLHGAKLTGAKLTGKFLQPLLARILVLTTNLLQTWKQRFLSAKGARKAAWGCLPILGLCVLGIVVERAAGSVETVTPTPAVIASQSTVIALQPTSTPTPEVELPIHPTHKLIPATDRTRNPRGINEAIQQDLQGAVDKVRELTGVDLGIEFGDTSRPLELAPTKVGTDPIDWHKTGRAIDLDQASFNNGVIAKDPSGDDMFFRIYLPYEHASAEDSDLPEKEKRYLKKWKNFDQGNFSLPPQPNKWYVDVTAIFEDYGFNRIEAHPGWEETQTKMEWWHFEKRDGLTMYRALRQVYTEDQIIDGHKHIYRSNKVMYRKRLLKEGFPEEVLDKMEEDQVTSSTTET
jgi:hypothetical protein